MGKYLVIMFMWFAFLSFTASAKKENCIKTLKLTHFTKNHRDITNLREMNCKPYYDEKPRRNEGFISFCKAYLKCTNNEPRINVVLCDKKCTLRKRFKKAYRKVTKQKPKFRIKPFMYGHKMIKRNKETVNVKLPITCHCQLM